MVTIGYKDLLTDIRRPASGTTASDRAAFGTTTGSDTVESATTVTGTPEACTTAPGTADVGAVATHLVRSGRGVFVDHLDARSIRQIACDADIIPLVLGGDGQILDIGRAGRLFPPHLRRAMVARDKGCAFPDCTIPAGWCEAHHITPWSRGGVTSVDNGVLLCAHHHHVIHRGHWGVAAHDGVPWFTPPPQLRRHGTTSRRNRYWNIQPHLPDRAPKTP
ncbi:hypothetical protein E8P82_06450 [Arthrobacter echini]|uniref:HNH nuclease domain-containing protein n=2 Tax=Arthrobacter echini TaxID=1529066 RepID=A0A4S5E6I9_9MICC|nr:hypothetical protein E8P82_06450 [Arthrobacter echini]